MQLTMCFFCYRDRKNVRLCYNQCFEHEHSSFPEAFGKSWCREHNQNLGRVAVTWRCSFSSTEEGRLLGGSFGCSPWHRRCRGKCVLYLSVPTATAGLTVTTSMSASLYRTIHLKLSVASLGKTGWIDANETHVPELCQEVSLSRFPFPGEQGCCQHKHDMASILSGRGTSLIGAKDNCAENCKLSQNNRRQRKQESKQRKNGWN